MQHALLRDVAACILTIGSALAAGDRGSPGAPSLAPAVEKLRPAAPYLAPAENAAREWTDTSRTSLHAEFRAPERPALDRVLFDAQPDGTVWARGARYKMRFGADGATYVPFLGSRAPRNYPITFRPRAASVAGIALALVSDVAARHDGTRVTLDRGALVERYDLGLDEVEQTFDVGTLPVRGALELRLEVETDLGVRATDAGVSFANELGHVRYEEARVLDARGAALALPIAIEAGEIVLRVPASFVDAAVLPIAVDPVISTYPIDDGPSDCYAPDVAYEVASNTWRAVYEETYSATDHDIVTYHFNYGGLWLPIQRDYVDYTTGYCSQPKIASNRLASTFLVVFARGRPGVDVRIIQGRLTPASSTSFGATFDVMSGTGWDLHSPDVGGDPALLSPSNYLVVWQRNYTASDTDVHARIVASTGAPGAYFLIDDSAGTLDAAPRVSKTNGNATSFGFQKWNIAWERQDDASIHAAQCLFNGTVITAPFVVEAGGLFQLSAPSPSSLDDGTATGRRWLVAYRSTNGLTSDSDIAATLIEESTVKQRTDLTAYESPYIISRQQVGPSADCDGSHFAVAYSELYPGGTYHAYVASFQPIGTAIGVMEGHQSLDFTSSWNGNLEICAGGAPRRFIAAWTRAITGAGQADIDFGAYEAARFTSFCFPGDGAIPCTCGNPASGPGLGCANSATSGATLAATGDPLADSVQLQAGSMTPTTMCLFTQSTAATAGAVFGDGVRCVSGTVLRLYTKTASGGVAVAPQGGDPSIRTRSSSLGDPLSGGARRYYQVYYRDPQSFGCTATFNMTNAVEIEW